MTIYIVEYGNNWDARENIIVYKTLKQAQKYLKENYYKEKWKYGKPVHTIYYERKGKGKWGNILIQEVIE